MTLLPDLMDASAGPPHTVLDGLGDHTCELAIAIDTLVDGVHFATGTAPADVGFKALAVNLSDLAAMAAEPRHALAAITHPQAGEALARHWLAAFEQGFGALAQRHGVTTRVALTARGPLCVSVEALGTVPRGMALRRAGAVPGDCIVVTGTLGDAGLALSGQCPGKDSESSAWLRARLARPEPRIEAGIALRGLASAAIDISDGLIADLGHILEQSHVGAELHVDALPLSPALQDLVPRERAWGLALSSGDDYELCFSVAPRHLARAEERLRRLACGCTRIGTVTPGGGLQCLRGDGSRFAAPPGYRHFS